MRYVGKIGMSRSTSEPRLSEARISGKSPTSSSKMYKKSQTSQQYADESFENDYQTSDKTLSIREQIRHTRMLAKQSANQMNRKDRNDYDPMRKASKVESQLTNFAKPAATDPLKLVFQRPSAQRFRASSKPEDDFEYKSPNIRRPGSEPKTDQMNLFSPTYSVTSPTETDSTNSESIWAINHHLNQSSTITANSQKKLQSHVFVTPGVSELYSSESSTPSEVSTMSDEYVLSQSRSPMSGEYVLSQSRSPIPGMQEPGSSEKMEINLESELLFPSKKIVSSLEVAPAKPRSKSRSKLEMQIGMNQTRDVASTKTYQRSEHQSFVNIETSNVEATALKNELSCEEMAEVKETEMMMKIVDSPNLNPLEKTHQPKTLEHIEGTIYDPTAMKSEFGGGDMAEVKGREMIAKIIDEKQKATANIDAMLKRIELELESSERERSELLMQGNQIYSPPSTTSARDITGPIRGTGGLLAIATPQMLATSQPPAGGMNSMELVNDWKTGSDLPSKREAGLLSPSSTSENSQSSSACDSSSSLKTAISVSPTTNENPVRLSRFEAFTYQTEGKLGDNLDPFSQGPSQQTVSISEMRHTLRSTPEPQKRRPLVRRLSSQERSLPGEDAAGQPFPPDASPRLQGAASHQFQSRESAFSSFSSMQSHSTSSSGISNLAPLEFSSGDLQRMTDLPPAIQGLSPNSRMKYLSSSTSKSGSHSLLPPRKK